MALRSASTLMVVKAIQVKAVQMKRARVAAAVQAQDPDLGPARDQDLILQTRYVSRIAYWF
jgi:hypothetical protein